MGDNLAAIPLRTGRTALAITAGGAPTCALLDDHTVKCWGWNLGGQLGLGDVVNRGDQPGEMSDALPAVAVGTGRTVTSLAQGPGHTCVLLDDPSIKCWATTIRANSASATPSAEAAAPSAWRRLSAVSF